MKEYESNLRFVLVSTPEIIRQAPGIRIFGREIRSLIFSTDIAIIRNCDADAVMAVYPFAAQPAINQTLIEAAAMPVFCDIGGEYKKSGRVRHLAMDAEFRGAAAAVVNADVTNETIASVKNVVDIPIVVTVVSEKEDFEKRIECGADIINVSAAADTCRIVEVIRGQYPYIPIIATGGPTDETILETIEAGADAITFTPPTNAEIFRKQMQLYREKLAQI